MNWLSRYCASAAGTYSGCIAVGKGSPLAPITTPMSSPSAVATGGLTIAVSAMTPALAIAGSPNPNERLVRSDMSDLPGLGAAIQRMFYTRKREQLRESQLLGDVFSDALGVLLEHATEVGGDGLGRVGD